MSSVSVRVHSRKRAVQVYAGYGESYELQCYQKGIAGWRKWRPSARMLKQQNGYERCSAFVHAAAVRVANVRFQLDNSATGGKAMEENALHELPVLNGFYRKNRVFYNQSMLTAFGTRLSVAANVLGRRQR